MREEKKENEIEEKSNEVEGVDGIYTFDEKKRARTSTDNEK
jgi:hypothetical protein